MSNLPLPVLFYGVALLLPALPRPLRAWACLVPPAVALAVLVAWEPGQVLLWRFLTLTLVVQRVDGLSLAFGYVFALFGLLAGLYALHLRDTPQQVASLVYVGSALGAVLAGDLFTLLVFWEAMALASTYLIWARGTPSARRAGMRYLFVHLAGGSLLMAGAVLHWHATGSLYFGPLEGGIGAWCILLAFAINAAIPPLHAWLPDSYPQGTVTGSVFLSAFTTKAAVYALARGFAGWEVLIWVGAVMAVYGVLFTIVENDIRGILSYHIVSQVGYMVASVGVGGPSGVNGATAHAVANILFKGLLFMATGAVVYATGASRLTQVGGLLRPLPWVLALYMVGACSISGVPLFSGFISKSLVIHAVEKARYDAAALMLYLAAVGTFLSIGLKLPWLAWWRPAPGPVEVRPVPPNMYVGMVLASVINIVVGIYPQALYGVLPFAVDYQPYTLPHLVETVQVLGFTAVGFGLVRGLLKATPTITLDTDWFYRRPGRVLFDLIVDGVNGLFGGVERVTLRGVGALVQASRNPIGTLVRAAEVLRPRGRLAQGASNPSEPSAYDPDRYRLPIGVLGLLLLALFVAVMVWLWWMG
ncbi:MAG: Na(+)/H(+) antiporter subunit D [Dehalococcoidia bacterium]|nr:Na(+)/H(+) antiporter subunit D [Dehalococcoidia bacterium]MDW8119798.1 Na(+)/H(+) antiporter subunit D [Chloroflexota bacterium]